MSTPLSHACSSNSIFFPQSNQTTPDHASANAMLAARKQQLAHLQTLQRQQQQVLQQMSNRGAVPSPGTPGMTSPSMASIMAGYGVAADGRDDRFSSSGLRSANASPMEGSQAGSNVSFNSSLHQRPVSPRRPAFECDYDTNPTDLYLAVQRKDWDGAVELASSCPHEASTWVSRKEGDGKLRWRLLPLHAAIIFRAPERTISALIFAFAQGAACKDDQGMLPLHLAFRNGCDGESINALLMAYPQSVDVQDRKGRTPMILAQQSTHANRDLYIRALERGAAYYAVANAAKDGIGNSPGHQMNPSPGVPVMPHSTSAQINQLIAQHAQQQQTPLLPILMNEAASVSHMSHGMNDPRISELEAELVKTQETSQVLVDHVNSLEAQLASRSDTERFLATKIANLDSQLRDVNTHLEASGLEIEAKKLELVMKDEETVEVARMAAEDVAQLKLKLADKKEAELKSYKLTNKERFDLEERVEVSERECAVAQANAAVLEAQLKKKIETEQSLASQVSMLASNLASSASSSSEASSAHQRKLESLTAENKKLQSHIEGLEGKLGTVATALDAMAAEQERIVEAATKHENTMASCAKSHQAILLDTTRQETLLEDAAKEREQIVSILMRQAEDAERTMADREKVLDAVKTQEEQIVTAAQERDAVVDSVNKQREYMDFMLNGELRFLKMTASEEECELVNENKKVVMENKKNEYLGEKPAQVETEEVDAADDESVEEVAEEKSVVEAEEPAVAIVEEEEVEEATVDADVAVEEEIEEAESEESEEQIAEDAALEEAANAVKAAMRAAENIVESRSEADDESLEEVMRAAEGIVKSRSEDDDESVEEAAEDDDQESFVGDVTDTEGSKDEDEESDEDEEDVPRVASALSANSTGYETPAEEEDDDDEEEEEDEAAIDAAISAASSDDSDDNCAEDK